MLGLDLRVGVRVRCQGLMSGLDVRIDVRVRC